MVDLVSWWLYELWVAPGNQRFSIDTYIIYAFVYEVQLKCAIFTVHTHNAVIVSHLAFTHKTPSRNTLLVSLCIKSTCIQSDPCHGFSKPISTLLTHKEEVVPLVNYSRDMLQCALYKHMRFLKGWLVFEIDSYAWNIWGQTICVFPCDTSTALTRKEMCVIPHDGKEWFVYI